MKHIPLSAVVNRVRAILTPMSEVAAARQRICNNCPSGMQDSKKICRACGCPTDYKTKLHDKFCDLGHWGAVEARP